MLHETTYTWNDLLWNNLLKPLIAADNYVCIDVAKRSLISFFCFVFLFFVLLFKFKSIEPLVHKVVCMYII